MNPKALPGYPVNLAAIFLPVCALLVSCAGEPPVNATLKSQINTQGFSLDCANTEPSPCRRLRAVTPEGTSVPIEPSSMAWSAEFKRVITVTDNYNDLLEQDAGQYVISHFDPDEQAKEIRVAPLFTPEQASEFPVYDLEGVTISDNRLYAIGSLALHGKYPNRDRWERHQFVEMELGLSPAGELGVDRINHVAPRWPNFRDWLISKSGHPWTTEQVQGRAEGEGINVEALAATSCGTLLVGLRGPLASSGGALVLELAPPSGPDQEPTLVGVHEIPPAEFDYLPAASPRTVRGLVEVPGRNGAFYVLLGPKGYEKEAVVLALWDMNSGELTKATLLPSGFVAEGVAAVGSGRILIADDLSGMIMTATEN
jgi:hypothetical protein